MKNLLIIISIFLITACSKDDDSQQPKLQEPLKTTNIYVGGSQSFEGVEKATIWKNGVPKFLSTEINNASRVNSVYVYNDIVYAVGFETDAGINIATLWIDGLKKTLSTTFSEAYSISGFKDVFYISGQYDNKASLWVGKNNNIDIIPISSVSNSVAKSIFITNDGLNAVGIYIAGKIGSNAWTYNISQDISTLATNISTAESIFVRGTDVYVTQNNTFLNNQTASLLKNGITQNSVGSNTTMFSIHGDEQNIYAAGVINLNNPLTSRATIWENYIPKQLSQTYSQANSVFVADKNVYVAGFEYDSNSAHFKSMLWINGNVQTISAEDCETKSVFVTVK